jgi:hypothetical protein
MHRLTPACVLLLLAMSYAGCATTESSDAPAEETPPAVALPVILNPYPGITVRPRDNVVEIAAASCLDAGWLEQIACAPQSREHESLLVVETTPSLVHAALLLAGFEAGAPGHWTYENGDYAFVAPTGSPLRINVQWTDAEGAQKTTPITAWIRDRDRATAFPDEPWIFGGSEWRQGEAGATHYAADLGGSLIGLVTFGDEVVGFSRVIADQSDVQAPEWMVDESVVPAPGTAVTIILEPWTGRGTVTGAAPTDKPM